MTPKKETIKIQLKMKQLDDVFHRLIISLERFEAFLELERLQGKVKEPIATTAIGTSRDLHNDKKNVPNRDTLLGEVQLQLTALYFQTKFDDIELFNNTMKYFLKDMLQWYGGRGSEIPYNEVDAFVLPIIVALSRQVKSAAEIMMVVKKYVATIKTIADYDEHQRFHAVMDGWSAYQIALERNAQESHEFLDSGKDITLTAHVRSTETEGFKRLYQAMTSMFDQPLPAKVLCRTISTYLPEVAALVPNATEDNIDKIFNGTQSVPSCSQETANVTNGKLQDEKISDSQNESSDTLKEELIEYQDGLSVANNQEEKKVSQQDSICECPSHDNSFENDCNKNLPENTPVINKYEPDLGDISDSDKNSIDSDANSMSEISRKDNTLKEVEQAMCDTIAPTSCVIEVGEFECGVSHIEESIQEKEHDDEKSFFTRFANKVKNPFSKDK